MSSVLTFGFSLVLLLTCLTSSAQTPITPSGLNTRVSPPTTLSSGKVQYDITGGTRPGGGANLFHSFGDFNILGSVRHTGRRNRATARLSAPNGKIPQCTKPRGSSNLQVRAAPAKTQAPEEFIGRGIELINELAQKNLGSALFRHHEIVPDLLKRIHRFRAMDEAGLFALAKDVARLTADSLDTKAMQRIISPPKDENWGSLKSLENLLASKVDPDTARLILSPLVGAYELRHADAHLPGGKVKEAFELMKVNQNRPTVFQGYELLHSCVSSLFAVREILAKW